MIYIKINEESFENKHSLIESFIDSLLKYISNNKDLIVVSKNTLDFQVLSFFDKGSEVDKFISRASSSTVLNGLKIAYDETLNTVSKVNSYFKNELGIKIEENVEDEDLTTFKFISKVPVHYINTEFNSTEDILKDFESREDENKCIIINLFSEDKDTEISDNVKVINIPKHFKFDKSNNSNSASVFYQLESDPKPAKPSKGQEDSEKDEKVDIATKFNKVFSENSEKSKNENT